MSTANKLFKRAAPFLDVIDEIVPIASKHEYTFVSDDWFKQWQRSDEFTVERANFIIALELIEKAHLASVTALLRAKRWTGATCLMYEKENFLGWVASFRGLLESAGDTLDGLLAIPKSLAIHHRAIAECLAGNKRELVLWGELEQTLDHFVHARWMRTKRGEHSLLKAKENANYVAILESVIPGITNLYHRLCSICHPSNASIEYFYDCTPGNSFKLLPTKDIAAISAICSAHPDVLQDVLMIHSNAPLLVLRVLHTFGVHPQLKALRNFDWKQVKAGAEIEHLLRK
jgi:hypothetical protein